MRALLMLLVSASAQAAQPTSSGLPDVNQSLGAPAIEDHDRPAVAGPQLGAQEARPPSRRTLRWTFIPLLGVDLGPLWQKGSSPVPPRDPAASGSVGTEFALDATLGGIYGARRREAVGNTWKSLWLLPQIGYSFATTQPARTDLFVAGLGVGVGSKLLFAAYTPRLVVGRSLDEPAVGIRQGVGLHLLYGLFGVELAHQWLHLDSGGQHDLRLMFRVNAGMLLIPLLIAAAGRSFS